MGDRSERGRATGGDRGSAATTTSADTMMMGDSAVTPTAANSTSGGDQLQFLEDKLGVTQRDLKGNPASGSSNGVELSLLGDVKQDKGTSPGGDNGENVQKKRETGTSLRGRGVRGGGSKIKSRSKRSGAGEVVVMKATSAGGSSSDFDVEEDEEEEDDYEDDDEYETEEGEEEEEV